MAKADYDLLPEEQQLIVALVAAWESVPSEEHQNFEFPPWGDTKWTLTHPGLPKPKEVPKVYLEDLASAGLITLTMPPPRTKKGSAIGGTVGITQEGRKFAHATSELSSSLPMLSTVSENSDHPSDGSKPIDFVAWCGIVLQAVLTAQESPNAATMGLRVDQLAQAISAELEDTHFDMDSSTCRQALVDAHRAMSSLGLIETVAGNRFRIPREQRDSARDQTNLWRSICETRLDPQEEQILRVLNRQSEQRNVGHALLRPVPYSDLSREPEMVNGNEGARRISGILDGLQKIGLARQSPTLGSRSASSTYSGLVWEHRRWIINDRPQSQTVTTTMKIDPIWRSRDVMIDGRLCFVLMPFQPKFEEIYVDHIKPTVERLPLDCRRADDIYGVRPIMEDVWEQLLKARVIIAELTDRNPNVFYEIGIAHAW